MLLALKAAVIVTLVMAIFGIIGYFIDKSQGRRHSEGQ